MFYSDKTNCDSRGKTDRHPLFLTLGNIPIKKRNFPNAKALIGFLPILKAQNESEKKSNLEAPESDEDLAAPPKPCQAIQGSSVPIG